jgi:Na+/H+ antiporter NhaD/arsenite permease-like protein
VLLLKSFVPNLQEPQRAWVIVAMAATLAGNFTLVGSAANLIVAQRAKARGVELDSYPSDYRQNDSEIVEPRY